MKVQSLRDKEILELHLRKHIHLNLYHIGDLDDFFWKYTDWYGIYENGELKHVALLYKGKGLPVLQAICENDKKNMMQLLEQLNPILPEKFYSHLSKDLASALKDKYNYQQHGTYLKMSLRKDLFVPAEDDECIKRINISETESLRKFYSSNYPDNWFDIRMLETGKYFGYYNREDITGAAGIHVYSPRYKVATLGNITTHADHRGKSICTKLTSALVKDLFLSVDDIGLNVNRENTAAIKSYKKIGFTEKAEYGEYTFEIKK